jgi:DNA-binding PadR family transcriptional regulator
MFDNSVRHFWSADQSQIYRTLSRLEGQGWVSKTVIDQEDRPDRKEYTLTAEGSQELLRWLQSPVSSAGPRSSPLVQVFFSGKLTDSEALGIFEQGVQILRAIQAEYDTIPEVIRDYQEQIGSEREAFFWNLTLESGQAMVRSQLEWMESVIRRIRDGKIPAANNGEG